VSLDSFFVTDVARTTRSLKSLPPHQTAGLSAALPASMLPGVGAVGGLDAPPVARDCLHAD
jgi:hypothetical protein